MARVVLIAGLVVLAGCGAGSPPDRGQKPPARPTRTGGDRVLTASGVDVLPGRSAGFPGGSVGCEVQERRMLIQQARHGAAAADRAGARVMLRQLRTAGDFQSGCSSIVIPVRRR